MEENRIKLSIIIPMYNAEKYIGNCLNSILNSDLPKEEYEVIVINDGSTDKGPEIAQTYASRFPHFRYLTQENQGQSVARNYGIKESKGEYIWCVDSDDEISSSSASSFFNHLYNYSECDIIGSPLSVYNESGELIRVGDDSMIIYNQMISGRNMIMEGFNVGSVCGLLVKKYFLFDFNLFFKEGITHQDFELSIRLFNRARLVLFVKESPYKYIVRKNSTSQSAVTDKRKKYVYDNIELIQTYKNEELLYKDTDCELSELMKRKSQGVLFGLLLSMYKNRKKWNNNGLNESIIKKLHVLSVFPLSLKNCPLMKIPFLFFFNIYFHQFVSEH